MEYDIIVIGGGPCGLAFAQCCSDVAGKILILESEDTLGGCHRVRRVHGLFTEHGPRVYSDSYVNFMTLLAEMNADFYRLFTPYKFNMSTIGGATIFSKLTPRELTVLGWYFIKLLLDTSYGEDQTVEEFLKSHNFGEESIDIIDRICRLTDGAASDRYTMNKFLELFNQQYFHTLYQPRKPNDVGLFQQWGNYLKLKGVHVKLSERVVNVQTGVNTNIVTCKSGNAYSGKRVVFAVPPRNLVKILSNSNDPMVRNAFTDIAKLQDFSEKTAYFDYINVTFHWDQQLRLRTVYGFPRSEWGVAFVVLTDYMEFNESTSKTVISIAITRPDAVSKRLGIPAYKCSEAQIYNELFTELKVVFGDIPQPTVKIISPGNSFEGVWVNKDTAYISTSKESPVPFQSVVNNTLYTLGTHNGKSLYKFTSMESAVTNAMELSLIMYPQLREKYNIRRGFTVRDAVVIFILIACVLYVIKTHSAKLY